jgi:uncharacterized protein DUF1579
MTAVKTIALTAMLSIMVISLNAYAQDAGIITEMMTMPGPEHEQLHRFAGIWEMNITMYPPDGKTLSAVTYDTTVLIHEGRFVHFQSQMSYDGLPTKSDEFLGFNRVTEKYVYTRIHSMTNGIEIAEGSFDESTEAFTLRQKGYVPGPDGKAVEMEYTLIWDFEGENMFKFSIGYPDVSGKMFPLLETLAIRIE